MNKTILLLVFFLTSNLGLRAQLTNTLDIEQIKLTMKFQETNWNIGNIPAYMEGYWNNDSLLFIGSKGPTYGYQQTLKNYLKSYPTPEKMGKLTFEIIKIDLISKTDAFVVGKWRLDRKTDVLKGHYTLLWRKIEGKWKIVVDHSS